MRSIKVRLLSSYLLVILTTCIPLILDTLHLVTRDDERFAIVIILALSVSFFISLVSFLYILSPVILLSNFAKKFLTNGDVKLNMPKRLFLRKDEVGILAQSFSGLLKQLQDQVTELRETNQQLLAVQSSIKTKNEELSKINSVMIGRELKMVELKNEIEKLNNLKSRRQKRAASKKDTKKKK